eukprot:14909499-Heterocapsa_arctica.AAC.1
MKRLLRYLRGTSAQELELSLVDGPLEVLGVADAAWATGTDRKSVSGGVIMFQGLLLGSFSKRKCRSHNRLVKLN